jgi:hypothetical protein
MMNSEHETEKCKCKMKQLCHEPMMQGQAPMQKHTYPRPPSAPTPSFLPVLL